MTLTLIYGKITGRSIDRKNIVYQINGHIALKTPSGSLVDCALSPNKWGWFAYSEDRTIADFKEKVSGESDERNLNRRMQNLQVSARRMVEAHSHLSTNDQAIVLNALSCALTGTASVLSGIGAVSSFLMGDFTGCVIPGLISGVTGFISYMSYENMTAAMRRAYDASEAFSKALDNYHNYCVASCPEHMQELPIYSPDWELCTKIVNTVLPKVKTSSFMYNDLNWSVA